MCIRDRGWIVPVVIAFLIGLAIDWAHPKTPMAVGTNETVDGDVVTA